MEQAKIKYLDTSSLTGDATTAYGKYDAEQIPLTIATGRSENVQDEYGSDDVMEMPLGPGISSEEKDGTVNGRYVEEVLLTGGTGTFLDKLQDGEEEETASGPSEVLLTGGIAPNPDMLDMENSNLAKVNEEDRVVNGILASTGDIPVQAALFIRFSKTGTTK